MQAANIIQFIEPFYSQGERDPVEPSQEAIEWYQAIIYRVLSARQEGIRERTFSRGDQKPENYYELILRIDADDGSHLHIVIYGTAADISVGMNAIVNITEFDDEGKKLRGYMYSIVDDAIRRTDIDESLGEYSHVKFSYLEYIDGYYRVLDKLESEWDEEQAYARETLNHFVNSFANAELEAEMQLNRLPVSVEEVIKLGEVLMLADVVREDDD